MLSLEPIKSSRSSDQEFRCEAQGQSGEHVPAFVPPRTLIWGLLALCALPALGMMQGLDFGTPDPYLEADAFTGPERVAALPDRVAALYDSVRGGIIHALTEWAAVAVACFTVILGIAHYRLRGDNVTLIITLALFWSGCMDAFHTLAATRLIEGAADPENFVPFTWAISRIFNIVIILAGIAVLSIRRSMTRTAVQRWFVPLTGIGFGLIAYGIIYVCATSPRLPRTMYPDAWLTRPFDFAPLVLFCLAALVIFPRLHRRHRTLFSFSLWLSAIPEIATEAHMTFGSHALFDGHFHVAHVLKVVAYAVPLMGLVLEYIASHRQLEVVNRDLARASVAVETKAAELEALNLDLQEANSELQNFAYVASHDLRAPLRAIDNLSEWIEEDAGDTLADSSKEHLRLLRGRVHRMDALLLGLLHYARIGRRESPTADVDIRQLVAELIEMHDPPATFAIDLDGIAPTPRTRPGPESDSGFNSESDSESVRELDSEIERKAGNGTTSRARPRGPAIIHTNRAALGQVFGNLIGNAIRHHDRPDGRIEIRAELVGDWWHFGVIDDGPGIASEYHDKVFEMFQTLRPRDEVEGSGMGLALVRKQVHSCGGSISLDSAEGEGARIRFTWPVHWPRKSSPPRSGRTTSSPPRSGPPRSAQTTSAPSRAGQTRSSPGKSTPRRSIQ